MAFVGSFRPDFIYGQAASGFVQLYTPNGRNYRASDWNPSRYPNGERYRYASDFWEKDVDALFAVLHTQRSGREILHRKFYEESGDNGREIVLTNPANEPACVNFYFNVPSRWLSHFENTPHLKLVNAAKYSGINGDELELEFAFLPRPQ